MASASSSVVAGDEKSTTEKYRILAHGRTYIDVVYTNEAATVDRILRMYEGWLDEDEDRFKFVGLDLEYDSSGYKLAVMQIAMREHVLVFHYIRCKDHCPRLLTFLKDKQYTFTSVDKRNDTKVLRAAGLPVPEERHIDIQDIFKIKGQPQAGMADLAAKLIDPKFANMKKEFKYNRRRKEGHDFWECKPLSWMNLEYAAIDGYLSYEIYNKIYTVNEGQAHLQRSDHICPRNPTMEIFSELDEINAQGPIFARSFQKTEGERKWGHEAPPQQGGPGVWGPRVALVCGALVWPPALPFRLLKAFVAKPQTKSHDTENPPRRRRRRPISGISEIASGTCRRGESSPEDSSPPWSPPE
ncbi:hypothetical protein QYE76_071586 [Lolium multiflorum]|uniref:3'-5' exonuclease domain-containing protein n=1 Tax=Lolium multiflorum TaxID=4521 RepID=A0AAD8SKD3_LOLMU|nr:hypothetical protein QYE76_071586 [Lolium multiflorum]